METEQKMNQQPTEEIYIEGVGTVKVYGKMDMKKMVQRMLKSKAITD